mmetsp:Transcript_26206/g.61155  ORF Transcript_26206/g.61155 Transcript_26206/m.61155 type:complete len:105 (+) Transcript_26206:94-408(+)
MGSPTRTSQNHNHTLLSNCPPLSCESHQLGTDGHTSANHEGDAISDVTSRLRLRIAPGDVLQSADVVPHLLAPSSSPAFGGALKVREATVLQREVIALICHLHR